MWGTVNYALLTPWLIALALTALGWFLQMRYGKSAASVETVLGTINKLLESGALRGGGGVVGRYSVLAWLGTQALPAWSQQQTELSDGESATQRYNSCGETCVAMVVAGVWGVPVSPDAIRGEIAGVDGNALTTGGDLVRGLRANNIAAADNGDAAADAWSRIAQAGDDGRPCMILGVWPTPGGALHWLLTTGVAGDNVNYINPCAGVILHCSSI